MKLISTWRKTYLLNERVAYLNMAKPLAQNYDFFPYWATLINNGIFVRQKESSAKFQNITKGTTTAILEYFLFGFVGHLKIKCMFCVKNLLKNL